MKAALIENDDPVIEALDHFSTLLQNLHIETRMQPMNFNYIFSFGVRLSSAYEIGNSKCVALSL